MLKKQALITLACLAFIGFTTTGCLGKKKVEQQPEAPAVETQQPAATEETTAPAETQQQEEQKPAEQQQSENTESSM